VAGPVGEALIMTALGLAVAVPAVLGYNWLVRRNKSVHGRGARLLERAARRCCWVRARAHSNAAAQPGRAGGRGGLTWR
jgi:biopolymer transport protein ExbB/TolQ